MGGARDDNRNDTSEQQERTEAIRAVLQRHASGRDHDTTFDHPHAEDEKAQQDNAGAKTSSSRRRKADPATEKRSTKEILEAAGRRALGGGLPGAAAMGLQVGALMWMRTTMNYQYRYGTSTGEALRALYKEGGVRRFYRGVGPALFQGPLSRFGDTAANAGMLSLLNSNEGTRDLPIFVKTMAASVAAGLWRINLMPIDTCKTIMQVEGAQGIKVLKTKVATSGPRVLYAGALGAFGATWVGHFPWFATHNFLDEKIPKQTDTMKKLGRNAMIGFCSSFVSDCCSNSIRVIKTTKQTSAVALTYPQTVKMVIEADGLSGLFIRGLQTRILANGMQGMLFTVLWKYFEEKLNMK